MEMFKVSMSLDLMELTISSEMKHNSQIGFIQNFKCCFLFFFSFALLNLLTVKQNEAEKLLDLFISLLFYCNMLFKICCSKQ